MNVREYTLIIDPDDIYLNENLFIELYNYNQKYNLDIYYPLYLWLLILYEYNPLLKLKNQNK